MAHPKIDELTDKVRTSKFGREVLGPKVARPMASWLEQTFGDDIDASTTGTPSTETGDASALGSVRLDPPDASPASDTATLAGDVAAATRAESQSGKDGVRPPPQSGEDGVRPHPPAEAAPSGFKEVALAVKDRIKDHNLVVVAAGIAFWGLLAIPAVLFASISIAGLVLDEDTVKDEVNNNLDGLPEEAREIIGDQLQNVSGGSTGGLITGVILGIVLALWTSSGAMAKMMGTLNTIYGVKETRKFVKLRGTALLMTLGGILFVASAGFLLAVLPKLLSEVDGVGDSAATLFNWLRFPALGLVMVIGLGVLYHVGPDRRGSYQLLTVGAVVATVLWIVLSGLFSVYTATAGSYNETYGSLGGLVILLLWLMITALVVLIGAEIHALTGRSTRGRT